MGTAAVVTLLIAVIAAGLLISERLRPDLIALLVLVSLGIAGLVQGEALFSGFSGSAVITILGISIISEGLQQTGVTHLLARQMQRLAGRSERRLIVVSMLVSAGLSLFMNNIAAVGVLLPAVMTLTRRVQVAPSRLLLPLAYGTTLGGMATLLTTSNIILSGALRDAGYRPFGLLDFLPIGAPLVFLGIAYMLLVGRRLIPARYPVGQTMRGHLLSSELVKLYGIDKNLVEIEVLAGSSLAHRSLIEARAAAAVGGTVVGLYRNGRTQIAPTGQEVIQPGDVLLVQGSPDHQRIDKLGLRQISQPTIPHRVAGESIALAEVVLSPHTTLIGKTLRDVGFRERYELNVLAIWRAGKPVSSQLSELALAFGDALLVQGPASHIRRLRADRDLIVLEEDPDAVLKPRKGRLALLITLITLLVASSGLFSLPEVAMAGAALMLVTECLGMNDAYRAIEWKAIFLIAGMWPLSIAIRSSGLADSSIQALLAAVGQVQPLVLAGILMLVGVLLTQIMGGQVAALALAPLAISAAAITQTDPRSMAMAVALSCSIAFPTPLGHPVNIMVMGSGGYTTRDFLKIGLPLSVLVFIAILGGLHVFWGL